MPTATALQLLLVTCFSALPVRAENDNHLVIAPQDPVLEIGTHFMATCMIINTTKVTTDDLYWNMSKTTVPKEQYTKINSSALNVTIPVTSEELQWLFCLCKKVQECGIMNSGTFIHGTLLTTGYRPGKPENLSCVAPQEDQHISRNISCVWEPVGRQTTYVPTTYTLNVRVINDLSYNVSTDKNSAPVLLEQFPNHMQLEIWVEAHNKLGKIESDHLKGDANWFVKTNPPSDVNVNAEKSFPSSLLINWRRPIVKEYLELLTYQIRYSANGSQHWTYVPLEDTDKDIQSFRLQNLQPDTVYVIQVCCKHPIGHGYWSNWSTNATKRTPEHQPTSKPDLWKIISDDEKLNERQVKFVCKDPASSNGRIIRFDIKFQDQKDTVRNGSWELESIPVNSSETDSSLSQQKITVLKQIHLHDKKSIKVYVTAINSVGKSPEATLVIPNKAQELSPVEELEVVPDGGQLWLRWKAPNSTAVSEYVVEWVSGDQTDWQRETGRTTRAAIKGNLEQFVCYNVSVYPIYSGWIGKPASKEAFLEQEAPLEGPTVRLNGKPGRNNAHLVWKEIPLRSRRGFITNYTIFYTNGTEIHDVTVPANATSFTLKTLSGNTKYETWIRASTVRGSANGTKHSFTTLKYAPGEIEGVVVGVSLGFLFVVLMTLLLCVYKKDLIKENCWPQIPNPGESTIGNWSPDYPLKAETPKENCLSGISVLAVDVYDGKSVFEEDKSCLPLKKDKYLSEEHSSGIGGSSCMSSPRQSVSDSDEGGDLADTTASTVQYSSVVASNGYKGQTPSSQPQQALFSRSESTQPLLDCEENPEDGSRQAQAVFTHTAGHRDMRDPAESIQQGEPELDFCPLEETPTDGLPAPAASSYMPQLGGYRHQ